MIWKFLTINDYFANVTRYFTLKQNKIKPNSYLSTLVDVFNYHERISEFRSALDMIESRYLTPPLLILLKLVL